MRTFSIVMRNVKWRFKNMETIIMTLIQPLIWLLLFTTMFQSETYVGDNYTAYTLPGILILVTLTSSGMSGISNYSWKSDGIFYRIFISPVKRSSIVLGHIFDAAILTFVEVFILFIFSFFLSVKIATGVLGCLLIIGLIFLTVFFVASLSYALSMVFKTENSFLAIVNTLILPIFFVSTSLMSYEYIPAAFKIPVSLNPFTYVINCIRELILHNSINWNSIIGTFLLFLILGVLAFLIALHVLKTRN
ncbi:ABC transporter permease [Paenibacillus faecis]|uniref:ABC transporter permease n=1 Tax=Paenibacillus faecis TaxID=862114 RepID=UPI001BCF2B39|nr:ABC transporter permease [Paenibacillus faecis]